MHISVLICTRNRAATLRAALDSLTKLINPQGQPWELIVVDNNSTDATPEVVQSYVRSSALEISYLHEPKQGLSHARNAAIHKAKGHIIAFTDDDVKVDPEWLAQISATFERYGCAGVGGRIVADWNCSKPSWLVTEGPYKLNDVIIQYDLGKQPREITMKTLPFGANMAFLRQVFDKYGAFRTDLGFSGGSLVPGEESEFCRRLLASGERVMYSPFAIVHHPVDKVRLTKQYFKRWYYGFGRSAMRVTPVPEVIHWFGAPRYLLRVLAGHLARWAFSLSSQRRFYYELQVCQCLGELREAREAYRNRPKGET